MDKLLTYFHGTNIAELCAFAAAVLLLNKRTGIWRVFIPLILLTICTEASGWYLNTFLHMRNNALPFNILMLVNRCLFILFFTTAGVFRNYRIWMYAGAVGFLAVGAANLLWWQGLWTYNYYSEAAGDLVLAFICCAFFLRSLREDTYHDFFRDPYFWLANGLLFASMGNALLYLYLEELSAWYRATKIDVYGPVNSLLNVIFYVSLIIAFICRWKTTRLLPEW
jgi:hypothetical protein